MTPKLVLVRFWIYLFDKIHQFKPYIPLKCDTIMKYELTQDVTKQCNVTRTIWMSNHPGGPKSFSHLSFFQYLRFLSSSLRLKRRIFSLHWSKIKCWDKINIHFFSLNKPSVSNVFSLSLSLLFFNQLTYQSKNFLFSLPCLISLSLTDYPTLEHNVFSNAF